MLGLVATFAFAKHHGRPAELLNHFQLIFDQTGN